jgi:hypothetical protein
MALKARDPCLKGSEYKHTQADSAELKSLQEPLKQVWLPSDDFSLHILQKHKDPEESSPNLVPLNPNPNKTALPLSYRGQDKIFNPAFS